MMTKSILLFCLCIIHLLGNTQNISFEVVPPPSNLIQQAAKVHAGYELHSADVDGDGDQDVLSLASTPVLYKNNGAGILTATSNTFHSADLGSACFADVDNDTDLDLFITGGSPQEAKLYLNDGSGNFSLDPSNSFHGVNYARSAFFDMDSDGDKDLIYGGATPNPLGLLFLYENDGSGSFSDISATAFSQVVTQPSSIVTADVDGDLNVDVLIMERFSSQARLLMNAGNGTFSILSTLPFSDLQAAKAIFFDGDNDLDQDMVVAGNAQNGIHTRYYENDGLGNFTLSASNQFMGGLGSTMAIGDLDGDLDKDVILSYSDSAGIYLNDANGNFSLNANNSLPLTSNGTILVEDLNGDTAPEIVITGSPSFNQGGIILQNDGIGYFTPITGSDLPFVTGTSMELINMDSDPEPELLLSGEGVSSEISQLFDNTGAGHFTPYTSCFSDTLSIGKFICDELNGDSFEDILITGNSLNNGRILDGNGTPHPNWSAHPAISVYASRGELLFDLDGDNDLDMVYSSSTFNNYHLRVFINDGTGSLSAASTISNDHNVSAMAHADIDGDGDQDLLVSGQDENWDRITRLYLNDGIGNFSLTPSNIVNVWKGAHDFADVDNDGDQDLVMTGETVTGSVGKLYQNDGHGTFTEVQGTLIPALNQGTVDFIDFDNDSDPDLILTGAGSIGTTTMVLVNEGSRQFSEIIGLPLEGVENAKVELGDLDGDGRTDIILNGSTILGPVMQVYRNTTCYDSVTMIHACDAYSVPSGDETYTTIGTYSVADTVSSFCGTTGIISLELTLGASSNSNILLTECDSYHWNDNGTTYDSSGIYTTTLINSVGCDSVVNLQLQIINSSHTDTSSTVCDQFNWYGNTYDQTGNYTRILTNSVGCDSIITLHLIVDSINPTVQHNNTFLVANDTNSTYQWLNCLNGYSPIPGATNQSLYPYSTGQYAVELQKGGCVDTSLCYIIIETGILENMSSRPVVHPNPSSGEFKIEVEGEFDYEVFNTIGQSVLARSSTRNTAVVTGLSSGSYMVKVYRYRKVTTMKVLVISP